MTTIAAAASCGACSRPAPNPEERLEELLAQRRRELDEHAEQLHASIAELERREELLRDSRASVERMLRLGTSDLEARETELTGYLRELTEREKVLADEAGGSRAPATGARSGRAQARRGRAPRAGRRSARGGARRARGSRPDRRRVRAEPESIELAFVPGSELRARGARGGRRWHSGWSSTSADETFVVARIGRSPLPGDSRRCAYLVRGVRGREPSSPGSS